MSETLKQLHQQAQSLNEQERAELAYLLLTSLDQRESQTASDEDLSVTLARRSADVTRDHAGHAAEDVHASIRQRYS